jgi:selenocysteine-specific elongation factor
VPPLPLTIGTAGHIDHGKTALVQALTGRDTDRLPEERQRGISIELGFAELNLGERCLSVVDVPGHERFVRTMVAGASGVDMFLLVVAADDGPMPQTREHLTVLHALGVERGVLALSKVDLVEAEVRRRASEVVAGLAPGMPLIAVSSQTGEGLEDLRAALSEVAATTEVARREHEREPGDEPPVLHVDRVFTVAGHGTVVTGTLWSGELRSGQRVALLPQEREARVRSIQVHDRSLDVALSRQRVALNLAGVPRDEVRRGDVVTAPGADIHATYRLDVELIRGSDKILGERRVQVHLGTRETPARVADLGDSSAQLRLEQPLLAREGDRVVVRSTSPPDTLGGGIVIHPDPPRHGPDWSPEPTLASKQMQGPLARATESAPSPLARRLLTELRDDGSRPRTPAALAEDLGEAPRHVERALGELVAADEAVRVRRDVVYPASEYGRLRTAVLDEAHRRGSLTLAEARDLLGISRKYAQALLEHLNMARRLHRDGDRHFPES